MTKEEMRSEIKGDSNKTTQIGVLKSYNFYTDSRSKETKIEELKLDEKACEILKNVVEEENDRIIVIKDFSGKHIQCGNAKFSVSSKIVGEKEMAYWESSLDDLINNDLIVDVGHKGEVFKVTKRGYEFYDYYGLSKSKSETFKFNNFHIEIIKMFKDNDETMWDSQLKKYYNDDYDKEIAFEELKEAGYIVDGMVGSFNDGWCYNLNSAKKLEILKLLKERR